MHSDSETFVLYWCHGGPPQYWTGTGRSYQYHEALRVTQEEAEAISWAHLDWGQPTLTV